MSRADRVTLRAAERELDALLVAEAVNLRYLTGFTGTSGLALVGPELRIFATDFRYVEQAAEQVDSRFEHRKAPRELLDVIAEALPPRRPLRLGFDDAHVTVKGHARLGELLGDEVELVPAAGLVEAERAVKEPEEIASMRAAAALADEALEAVLGDGLAGRTEQEVARRIEQEIRRRGAEPSFPPIVAAGAHGARPHAEPRDVEVAPDELVVVDWGAQLEGYCSDCTRTLATGGLDPEAGEVYDLVLSAQLAALGAVRPGPTGKEVDAVAREIIAAAGHGEEFGHGLGHGVGLEVHEEPRLSKKGEDPLVAGNAVTVEPGVYLPGRFGVRIEDLVVVTEDGVVVLSGRSKELAIVA